MAPLLMQVLRERSRSTIIYFLFAILIIVFVFTFNTSGGSGGCSPTGAGGAQLATVHDTAIDISLISMGERLTPDFQRPAGFEFLPEELRLQYERPIQYSRFYYLSSFPLELIFDASVQRPIDSPVFKETPNAKYAFFRRNLGKLDTVKRIRVMNDLLESYLVGHEAKTMGIRIPENDLNRRFFNVPEAYRSEDMGDVPTADDFNQYLSRLGVSTTDYRTFVENEMLREKLIDIIANLVTVRDGEVDRVYQETKEATIVEYIEVNPEQIAPLAPVSDEDIAAVVQDKETLEAEYKKRQSTYRQKKKITVRALLVEAPDVNAEVETDVEASAEQKAALEAADALYAKLAAPTVEPAPEPSPEDSDKSKDNAATEDGTDKPDAKKAEGSDDTTVADTKGSKPEGAEPKTTEEPEDAFTQTQKKFIELVKSDSADDSKSLDGLYTSAMNELYLELRFGKEVAKTAYALERGQYTKPILGKRGYWILFVDDVEPESIRTLEDVTSELARELASKKKAVGWSKTVADELFAMAQSDPTKDLEAVADQWNETHQPPATETKPGGPDDEAPPKAFDTPDTANEKGKEDASGDEKGKEDTSANEKDAVDASDDEDYAEDDEAAPVDFPGMLRRYSSTLRRLETAMPPIWSYPTEVSSDQATKTTNDHTDKDNAWAEVEGIGNDATLKVALLALTKDKPLFGKVYRAEGSERSFVIRFVETTKPTDEEVEQDKASIRNTLRAHQQLEAYRAWYAGVLDRSTNNDEIQLLDAWHQFVTAAWKDEQRQLARDRKKKTLSIGQ